MYYASTVPRQKSPSFIRVNILPAIFIEQNSCQLLFEVNAKIPGGSDDVIEHICLIY
jgi:hypothetical protein